MAGFLDNEKWLVPSRFYSNDKIVYRSLVVLRYYSVFMVDSQTCRGKTMPCTHKRGMVGGTGAVFSLSLHMYQSRLVWDTPRNEENDAMIVQILADVAELKATLASTEKKKAELEGQAKQTTDQLK